MKDGLLQTISAYWNGDRFSRFLRGVEIALPTGEVINIKATRTQRKRVDGRFHASNCYYATEIKGGGYTEIGYGEAQGELLALQKSIAEGIERLLFRVLKGSNHGTQNSNGWAAHISRPKAEKSALFELLERDAVLVHWLTKTPFSVVTEQSYPAWIRNWQHTQLAETVFPFLTILISHLGHAPTASVAIHNDDGHGVVSHAAGESLDRALIRALSETCRLARMATSGEYYDSSLALLEQNARRGICGPSEQAVVYAHHLTFPNWIFGEEITWVNAKRQWKVQLVQLKRNPIPYVYHEILSEPLSVGFCTSPVVQNLFFGKTTDAKNSKFININRLQSLKNCGELNLMPHFVA